MVTGEVVGGRLKTPADADSESLQAKWVGDLSELSLRARDVVSVVERGRQYREAISSSGGEEAWHEPQVRNCRFRPCFFFGLFCVF